MIRRIVFGLCLVLTLNNLVFSDDTSSVKGTMTVDGKNYELTYVRAFRIKSDGQNSIAVVVTERPFQPDKLEMFSYGDPPGEPTWIDVFSISNPTEFKLIRKAVPQLQAVFNVKTLEFSSYLGWANNHTFNAVAQSTTVTTTDNSKEAQTRSVSKVGGTWTAKVEENHIVGSGKSLKEFDFEFKAPIENLPVIVHARRTAKQAPGNNTPVAMPPKDYVPPHGPLGSKTNPQRAPPAGPPVAIEPPRKK